MRYLLIVAMLAGIMTQEANAMYIIQDGKPVYIGDDLGLSNVHFEGGDPMKDLISAAEAVLPYLQLENEEPRSLVYVDDLIPRSFTMPKRKSEELRDQADAMEKRDAAIKRFRDALKKAEGKEE
jgi:hypothetical protein